MFSQSDQIDKERRALCALAQISNENERMTSFHWIKKDEAKKIKVHNQDKNHRVSMGLENVRPEKLPMIIAKNNLSQHNGSFIKVGDRLNNYILFEKGLGNYGTVNFNRKKGRYAEQNSKFIKLYSQSSEQEIDVVKEWLSIKKESCKQYNSLLCKRRKSVKEETYRCLSIKNIL